MIQADSHPSPPRITLVTAPGCHFCEDAQQELAALAARAVISLDLVQATSPDGLALLARHRPSMNPLVLVDGAYFSSGRLPRRKLQALLASSLARPESTEALRG